MSACDDFSNHIWVFLMENSITKIRHSSWTFNDENLINELLSSTGEILQIQHTEKKCSILPMRRRSFPFLDRKLEKNWVCIFITDK